jgi:hypothetical protein
VYSKVFPWDTFELLFSSLLRKCQFRLCASRRGIDTIFVAASGRMKTTELFFGGRLALGDHVLEVSASTDGDLVTVQVNQLDCLCA